MKRKKYVTTAVIISVITAAFGIITVLDTEKMLAAAAKSIDVCLYTIIPSLFGFMALSSFLMRSGIYRFIFKVLYLPLRFFIRLGEEEFSVFMLSLVGGYPVGAKLISDAVKENPSSSLKKILPFCYCGSPVFITAVTGIGIFGKAEIGFIVYISNALANILICSVYAAFFGKKESRKVASVTLNQTIFTDSVISAASALLPVCAMVVIFGAFTEALYFCGIENIFSYFANNFESGGENLPSLFFKGFLEISVISEIPCADFGLLPFISALTSFGGCCILFQVAAVTGGRIKLKAFLAARIPAALLSAVICLFLLQTTNMASEALSLQPAVVFTETGNPVASVILLIMSAILLTFNRKSVIICK